MGTAAAVEEGCCVSELCENCAQYSPLSPRTPLLSFADASQLPRRGNVINLRQIHPFFVGADAYIGPKGSIFRPFGMIGKARNWLFPLHETLTSVRLRADVPQSAPTVKSLG